MASDVVVSHTDVTTSIVRVPVPSKHRCVCPGTRTGAPLDTMTRRAVE
jgi:hypothetical protein